MVDDSILIGINGLKEDGNSLYLLCMSTKVMLEG